MGDPEDDTASDIFPFDEDGIQEARQVLPRAELLARVTSLIQSCEGCGSVAVVGVTRLDLVDAHGAHILTLAERDHGPGEHSVHLDAAGLAPGMYLLRLQTPTGAILQKMIVE